MSPYSLRPRNKEIVYVHDINEKKKGFPKRSKEHEKYSNSIISQKPIKGNTKSVIDENLIIVEGVLTRSKTNARLILSKEDGTSRSSKKTKLDINGNIRNETTGGYLTRSKTRGKQSQFIASQKVMNLKSRQKCNICCNDIRSETKTRVRYLTRPKIHKKQSHSIISNKPTKFDIKQNEKIKKTLSDAKNLRQKTTKVNRQIKSKGSLISMQEGKDSQENENFNDDGLMECSEIKTKRPKTKSLKDKFRQRNSFERYGVQTPTFEEVLDRKIKIKSEADALEAFEQEFQDLNNSETLLSKKSNKVNSTKVQNLLDCKHLSSDRIKEYFQQNLDYIADISNGSLPSERHERFKNFDTRRDLNEEDLTYSYSIIVFEDTQINLLVELLEHYFNLDERTDYLFKVLLPEICLKIFMDEFGKTVTEAKNYLDWRPLD